MQVTTHQAGFDTSIARLALAQRIALAALAIFLMLNAVTPFITPDPPRFAAGAFCFGAGRAHAYQARISSVRFACRARGTVALDSADFACRIHVAETNPHLV